MHNSYINNTNIEAPYVLEETEDFAVVFKPPKMHSAPANGKSKKNDGTLVSWFEEKSKCFDIMHRLDFETHGLVLFAKNEKSFLFFKYLQDNNEFVKEYSAVCNPLKPSLVQIPMFIESYFRSYGPGRKLVRPEIDDDKKHKVIVKDKGGFYRTEIVEKSNNLFTVRIKRGFRHQIRCHLCWIGFPIVNDPLYTNPDFSPPEAEMQAGVETQTQTRLSSVSLLALRAQALFFSDPAGKQREYRIASLSDV